MINEEKSTSLGEDVQEFPKSEETEEPVYDNRKTWWFIGVFIVSVIIVTGIVVLIKH